MATARTGEKRINLWYGGISDDVREQVYDSFAISRHFDTISSPNKLSPYRDWEDETATDFHIGNFVYAEGVYYGLGRNTADTKTKLYYKNGGEVAGTWTAVTGGEATNIGGNIFQVFAYYKGFLYGIRNSNNLWRFEIATGTFTEAYGVLTTSAITSCPAQIGPDDNLYIAYDNRILSVSGSAAVFTAEAFLLPSSERIVSMTNFGDYLAIAVQPKNYKEGVSKVYLWNMLDADPTQIIIWGDENLVCIENIDNAIVGASISSNNSLFNKQILFGKIWSGGDVNTFKQIELNDTGYAIGVRKQLANNCLYFLLSGGTSTGFGGVWRIGRKNENYPWQLVLDKQFSNDNTTFSIDALYILGDYTWLAVNTSSLVRRTNDTASYTITSNVETQRYNCAEPSYKKRIKGVGVSMPAQPADGVVTVKYRKDAETSYTTIFTDNTNDVTSVTKNRISSTVPLPEFTEIQFRVETTGGTEPIELRFQYDVLETAID